MKPNTSALGIGGCSSWPLTKAEYREWYTDAVKKRFATTKDVKNSWTVEAKRDQDRCIRKSRNARQSRQRCGAQNRKKACRLGSECE
jgi:hypothetical protein